MPDKVFAYGYNWQDTIRDKPDGDWEWDPRHLRSVYGSAEGCLITNGLWSPYNTQIHLRLWQPFMKHLNVLRPGEGDAVESNQLYIDTLLLLGAKFMAASRMPLESSAKRDQLEEMFAQLPEHLTASLFGMPIHEAEAKAVLYRQMVRVDLALLSSIELIPGAVVGVAPEDFPTRYTSFTTHLDDALRGLSTVGKSFTDIALDAAKLVHLERNVFIQLQKIKATTIFPLDENGKRIE